MLRNLKQMSDSQAVLNCTSHERRLIDARPRETVHAYLKTVQWHCLLAEDLQGVVLCKKTVGILQPYLEWIDLRWAVELKLSCKEIVANWIMKIDKIATYPLRLGFKFQPPGLFLVVKGIKLQTLGGFRNTLPVLLFYSRMVIHRQSQNPICWFFERKVYKRIDTLLAD